MSWDQERCELTNGEAMKMLRTAAIGGVVRGFNAGLVVGCGRHGESSDEAANLLSRMREDPTAPYTRTIKTLAEGVLEAIRDAAGKACGAIKLH